MGQGVLAQRVANDWILAKFVQRLVRVDGNVSIFASTRSDFIHAVNIAVYRIRRRQLVFNAVQTGF